MAIDIDSSLEGPAGVLSNLTYHPFVILGIEFGSIEGFLQGLKCPDSKRQREIFLLSGLDAQRAGRKFYWEASQKLWWHGRTLSRNLMPYQYLLDVVFKMMVLQNLDVQDALLETGTEEFTHSKGKANAKKTVLTKKEFVFRLNAVRIMVYDINYMAAITL